MAKEFLEVMQEGEKLAEIRGMARGIPNLSEKVASLASLICNEKGYRTSMRKALLEEAATTSEFPIIFGTILDRQLLAKYTIAKPDWRNYIKAGSQGDFRPQMLYGVFGLQGGLNVTAPQTEYKQDAKLGEGKVQISLNKFGRRFGLGWEVIINDDLGAFSDIADRLSNAALRTEYREATKLIIAAGGGGNAALYGAPIVHPIDGKNVTNKFVGAGTALSVGSLGTTVQTMRGLLDADGEPIMIDGFELVVPPALEITALQILQSQLLLAAGGDSTAATKLQISPNKNVLPNFNITLHVNPYLPVLDISANKNATWYLFAKLSSGAAAQLNFLRGHENPELVMKNPNKITLQGAITNPLEGDFETDAMEWRVRHIMGGIQVDPRMTCVNVGA
jgi:hypothetical protein